MQFINIVGFLSLILGIFAKEHSVSVRSITGQQVDTFDASCTCRCCEPKPQPIVQPKSVSCSLEVVIVLNSAACVTDYWNLMLYRAEQALDKLFTGVYGGVRVGIVTYSTNATIESALNDENSGDFRYLTNKLKTLEHHGYGDFLNKGLETAIDEFGTKELAEGIKRVLILMTNTGFTSFTNTDEVKEVRSRLVQSGVDVFINTLTKECKGTQNCIGCCPDEEFITAFAGTSRTRTCYADNVEGCTDNMSGGDYQCDANVEPVAKSASTEGCEGGERQCSCSCEPVVGHRGVKGGKGERGISGERGSDGDIGLPGSSGRDGTPGSSGASGQSGTVGINGHIGPIGSQGVDGIDGEQGLVGPRGVPGFPGSNCGPDGDTGKTGLNGPPGYAGPNGAPGKVGEKGEPGEEGLRGGHGHTGARGRAGSPGAPGENGLLGGPGSANGEKGPKGHPGNNGRAGDRGGKGDTGDEGEDGAQGIAGHDGHQGPRGAKGHAGESGISGIPGRVDFSSFSELISSRIRAKLNAWPHKFRCKNGRYRVESKPEH